MPVLSAGRMRLLASCMRQSLTLPPGGHAVSKLHAPVADEPAAPQPPQRPPPRARCVSAEFARVVRQARARVSVCSQSRLHFPFLCLLALELLGFEGLCMLAHAVLREEAARASAACFACFA
jgi:hypothetical protein